MQSTGDRGVIACLQSVDVEVRAEKGMLAHLPFMATVTVIGEITEGCRLADRVAIGGDRRRPV